MESFCKSLCHREISSGKNFGESTHEILPHSGFSYLYERGVETFVDNIMPPRSWEMPVEHESAAKLGRCSPKFADHNFDPKGKSS